MNAFGTLPCPCILNYDGMQSYAPAYLCCEAAVQSPASHRSQVIDPLQVGTQGLPLLDSLQSEVIW